MLLSSFSDFLETLLNTKMLAAAGIVVQATKKNAEKHEVLCSKAVTYVREYVHKSFFENYFSFLDFKQTRPYVSKNLA